MNATTTIRIITATGKNITRTAEVADYIRNDGTQYSVARVGRGVYRIVGRDFDGPIWAAAEMAAAIDESKKVGDVELLAAFGI